MQAHLKINTLEVRTDKKGAAYAYGKATLTKKDGSTREDVIMAFGKAYESVKSFLTADKDVVVTANYDGGVLRILGRQAGAGKAAAAA